MSVPAVEVRSFAVTIPAGTPVDTPYTQDIFIPARILTGVHWKVPPGPSGLMGWRLTMSGGNAVIPTGGGWIISDDADVTWALTDQPDSGYWEVTGYNTDIYDHTVYLDLLLDLVGQTITNPALVTVPSGTITTPGTTLVSVPYSVSSPYALTYPYSVSVPGVSVPYSIPGPVSVPATSIPAPVSVPAPVTVPVVSVPKPVSVPVVSVPKPVSVPPVSVPAISVPPPITAIQPSFTDVVVPNVVGMRRIDAGPVIRQAGLTVSFSAAEGVVVRQRPAALSLVSKGSNVYLVLKGS